MIRGNSCILLQAGGEKSRFLMECACTCTYEFSDEPVSLTLLVPDLTNVEFKNVSM